MTLGTIKKPEFRQKPEDSHLCKRATWTRTESEKSETLNEQHQGLDLREKTAFFTQKKSRLRKSENAVRLLYAKNSDLTHQNAFSLFVFCT